MSSLVACPICNKNVPDWYMNDHLDRECKGVAEAVAGAGALDGEPVTPSRKRAKPASSFLVSPTKSPAAAKRPRSGSQHAARPPTLVQSHSLQMPNHADPFVDNAVLGKPKAADPPVSDEEKRRGNKRLPLAERLRPLSLDTFVGQQDLVGPTGMLRRIIENDQVTSMIFWGSPGLGKTTLARIIARRTKAMFKEMSGVTQNISDVRKVIEEAGNAIRLSGKRTILFLDEIHRFNKAQQDVFLPHLERGQITLIGATTENPSFKLNSALLSRCRVFRLENLTEDDIQCIAQRAAKLKQEDFGVPQKGLDDEIVKYVASVSNGDARVAINTIDLAMSALPSDGPSRTVSLDDIKNALQRTHTVYGAEEHYDLISALHKSVRGSDANAALYWLGRILAGGDDPLYVARRLIRMASEDIGLADNKALPLAVSAFHACQAIGMPECDTILAHCITYMARAPKSVETYKAYNRVKETLRNENPWPVPLHLRNAPTTMMENMGYGLGYKYNPDYDGPVDQIYLPEDMKDRDFFADDKEQA